MYQEVKNFSQPGEILKHSQIEALKSLSQLLAREIDSLSERQTALEKDVENKKPIRLLEELLRFEIDMIRCALIRTGGRQTEAAKLLGLKPTTLHEKVKRYGINLTDFDKEARA